MILHHGVNLPTARYIPARRISVIHPPGNLVRGHDISAKRIYKQLNPVESIRAAVKPLILVFSMENERHLSVYPAHEAVRLRSYRFSERLTLTLRAT